MVTTAPPLICPQGHGPGTPGSHFCNWCGTPLVVAAIPAQSIAPPPAPYNCTLPVNPPPTPCIICGGNGVRLHPVLDVCAHCAWLRPLLPGYQLDRSVFLWAQDGQAMTTLHNMASLTSLARSVSDKVGRPWIEATFNGIRLGPNQLPQVWNQAVLAARIIGMPYMPDVYVSGERMWDTFTFGSDTSSFIVLGTAIVTNFQGDDLLFVLAREMGHCRAGHALWKTVIRFLAGDIGPRSGLMSEGMLGAISPTKLIESAVEMPLMAWSRQSEITADRAGLLAVGNEALARRVLLAWSIRSNMLLKQINIEEWMKQEEGSMDQVTRISEMTTSSSMYTTRRLRLLSQSARETDLMRWGQMIQPIRKRLAPPAMAAVTKPAAPAPPKDSIRVVCNKCRSGLWVPLTQLQGKQEVNVRCPQCRAVVTLRKKPPSPVPALAGTAK